MRVDVRGVIAQIPAGIARSIAVEVVPLALVAAELRRRAHQVDPVLAVVDDLAVQKTQRPGRAPDTPLVVCQRDVCQLEISIVGIPADNGVGVGRNDELKRENEVEVVVQSDDEDETPAQEPEAEVQAEDAETPPEDIAEQIPPEPTEQLEVTNEDKKMSEEKTYTRDEKERQKHISTSIHRQIKNPGN